MAVGLKLSLSITGDKDVFERLPKALRNPRPFLEEVGRLGRTSAVNRLPSVLKQDGDAVRTGLLAGSIQGSGKGAAYTIFNLSDLKVEFGTNLRYAAQVQNGGRIDPKNAKALAIPLTRQLKIAQLSPSELPQATQDELVFLPTSKRPNIIGVLLLPAKSKALLEEPNANRKGRRINPDKGKKRKDGILLYAIAKYVDQQPRPFLFWSDADTREVEKTLIPRWLGI